MSVVTSPAALYASVPASPLVETLDSDAGWTWYSDPRAICYGRKLYTGFITKTGAIKALSRDLDTGAVETGTVYAAFQTDDHNNPAIVVLPNGKLAYFYSAHADSVWRYKISSSPESVASFGSEVTIAAPNNSNDYSNVFYDPTTSRVYLFGRARNLVIAGSSPYHRPIMTYADYSGGTLGSWSAGVVLFHPANSTRPYVKYWHDGAGRFDFFSSHTHPQETGNPPTPTASHMYHWYMEGGNLYRTDGTLIRSVASLTSTGPLTDTEVTRVFTATLSPASNAWPHNITRDATGKPVGTFTVLHDGPDNDYYYARWTGSAWERHLILAAQGGLYQPDSGGEPGYAAGLFVDPRDTNRVWVCKNTASGVWELEKWVTADGGANWATTVITTDGVESYRPFVPSDWDSGAPDVLWNSGSYTSYFVWDAALKAGYNLT